MGSNVKALKSGVWYTISNFLTKGIVFLSTPVFTRLLTQSEYGAFNNYQSWQGIFLIVATFNVSASLISARYDYEERFDEFILSAVALSTLSVGIWMLALNLFAERSQALLSMDIRYINVMMLYVLFMMTMEVFQMKQRYLYGYKLQTALSLTTTFLTMGLSVLLVIRMSDKLWGRVLGSVAPTILIGVALYGNFIVRGKRVDVRSWRYTLRVCLPYIPHLLSMTVLASTDRIMITRFCGSQDTALYSLAYSCGYMLSILLNSMNAAYIPWLAERLHENDAAAIRSFSKYYIGGFMCVALGVMMVAPEVLWVLGGERYLSAIYVMPPVMMGCACQFLYTMFVNIEQTKKKTVGMVIASVSAAALNYGLNLLLIPRYGYIAAAYTTLVGYLWLLGVHMFMVRRMGMAHVYSYRFIGLTVAVLGVCTVGINALYGHSPARYAAVGAYILVLLIAVYRKRELLRSFVARYRESKTGA